MWQAIGAMAVGQALSQMNDSRQQEQQRQMNEQAARLNYQYGEKAANNAFGRQMAMYGQTYRDNSPENRVQQLKDAGLSVGLMYGNGAGTGGMGQVSTAPQGDGSGGQQGGRASSATERQMAAQNAFAMGLQQKQVESSVNLQNAQAADLESQIRERDGQKKENIEANTELTKFNLSSGQAKLAQEIIGLTLNNEHVKALIEKTGADTERVKVSITEGLANVAKTLSETELNALKKVWGNQEIAQRWTEINIKTEQLKINQQNADTEQEKNQVQRDIADLQDNRKQLQQDLDRELNQANVNQKDRQKIWSTVMRMGGAMNDTFNYYLGGETHGMMTNR